MQKIWLFIQNQNVFVYVIAGLTFFGVLTRLMLQGKLHRLLTASENMAMTKERNMKTIRNHYENSLNMDIQVDHIDSFVEKYILKLKYGGIPIHIWNTLVVNCIIFSVATAFVGIIYAIHNSYPELYIGQILVAVIVACAVLLTVENSFRLEYFYDRVEANIADYLDNNLKSRLGRPLIKRRERGQAAGQTGGGEQSADMIQTQNDRLIAVASEIASQLRGQSLEEMEGMVDRTKTGYGGRGNARPTELAAGQNTVNQAMSERSMAEQGMVERSMSERGMAEQGVVERGMPERGMVEQGMVERGMPERGMAEQGMVERGMAEKSVAGQGMLERNRLGRSTDPQSLDGVPEAIPEYEIRRRSTRNMAQDGLLQDEIVTKSISYAGNQSGMVTQGEASITKDQIAAGQEEYGGVNQNQKDAEIIADVLRNFFSGN